MVENQVFGRAEGGHVYVKIPRHTDQNVLTEGNLECILTRLL